jgi:o-succinylbenzoate synthase
VKIHSLEVTPYALPFCEPYVTARGSIAQREMVLLRLRSVDGLVGLGEAVPLSMRGGAGLEQVVDELDALADLPALDEAILRDRAIALSPPARCAALTALLDLRGRLAGHDSEARAGAPPVECNATLIAGEPAAVAADAESWAADGFTSFKLKLGTGGDVDQVRAVREAVGPAARIRVDANAAWSVESARRTLAGIEPFDIELAEQPVGDLSGLAAVGQETSIPIAGDESIESCADAEDAVRQGACDYAGVKLSKVGGPEVAIEIAELMPTYLSSALDGPIGIAAAVQVAQTLDAVNDDGPRLAHGLATQRLFASTIASTECELRHGMLYPPTGPGLGVEIDKAALEAHRL